MLFDDVLSRASSPRELFDLLLALCFRGTCCTELHRLDGCSWQQFMVVHALACERIQNVPSETATPCLCVPLFVLQHPQKIGSGTFYAICAFPRHKSFFIVNTNMVYNVFGAGAETMKLILGCTPVPSISMVNIRESFVGMWNYNCTDLVNNVQLVCENLEPMPESFVHELVNARRRELGLQELSTS